MVGRTHKMVGLAVMSVSFDYMLTNGMLLPHVNPIVQLAIMYSPSQFGSVAPDYDHAWPSCPSKSVIGYTFHKLLALTRPKHRSWQTHSILVTGGTLFLLWELMTLGTELYGHISPVDWVVIRLILTGFILGVASHLAADFFNPMGIWLYPGLKMRGVPRTSFFATNGPWETKIVYPFAMLVFIVTTLLTILSAFGIDVLSYFANGHTL